MSANANARSATIKSYLYPTAIILTVFIGSVYGANLKQANQLEEITKSVNDPEEKIHELYKYRQQLIAQRLYQQRKLDKFRSRGEGSGTTFERGA